MQHDAIPEQPSLSPAETAAIAKDAYIYGYPMVQVYLTMFTFSIDKNNPQYKGPFNAPLSFARRLYAARHRFRHSKLRHSIYISQPRSSRGAHRFDNSPD